MLHQLADDLFRIEVSLPRNPLKSLNSYVILSDDRNLMIDTGFDLPECLADLTKGIEELGLDLARTDFYATHFHADHIGLIPQLASETSVTFMGAPDIKILEQTVDRDAAKTYWGQAEDHFRLEGYLEEDLIACRPLNPARIFQIKEMIRTVPVKEGDEIAVGKRVLRVIETTGHTPGHTCLYDAAHRQMFTGDHVLFDITPNIAYWSQLPDALGSYLDNLKKIRTYAVERTFPGHRGTRVNLHDRIDELLLHHEHRLADAENIIARHPGITAYEVASKMHWSIHAKDWNDFPPGQKWFAVGEALSHIMHLTLQGRVTRAFIEGKYRYSAAV